MLFFKNLIKFRLWGQKKVQFVHTFFLFWNTFGFRLISFFSSSLRYIQNCILNQNCFSSKIFYKKKQKNPSVSVFFGFFSSKALLFPDFLLYTVWMCKKLSCLLQQDHFLSNCFPTIFPPPHYSPTQVLHYNYCSLGRKSLPPLSSISLSIRILWSFRNIPRHTANFS